MQRCHTASRVGDVSVTIAAYDLVRNLSKDTRSRKYSGLARISDSPFWPHTLLLFSYAP